MTGFAIKSAGGFVPGETVLIQGATGVAGRLATQVARLLGAGRIVGTGRDDDALRQIETAWQRTDLRGRRLVVLPHGRPGPG